MCVCVCGNICDIYVCIYFSVCMCMECECVCVCVFVCMRIVRMIDRY